MQNTINNGKKVLIGGAWPYANGSLHLGHVAALLPGDILSRYFRLTGADVQFVSGSDCHGTPISMRAADEGVDASVIADRYHDEFIKTFKQLGFTYDLYTKTSDQFHKETVQKFFVKLYEKGLLSSKLEKMAYCVKCERFLPDRYLVGTCHNCGFEGARGDQCDGCGSLLDVDKLINKMCNLCGSSPEVRETQHLFLALSKFQNSLEELLDKNSDLWRQNAVGLSKRYLKEGLEDRAASRDLDWGIDVPIKGFEDKKIYVWIEAVLGYVTASIKLLQDKYGINDWMSYWNKDLISYYVHGKDNIPFHTLILPALLMGLDIEALPTYIISSEYLTIEGKKLSTSRNWAIWAKDYIERYDADPLRYFLVMNGPEIRDSDFSWREYVERNNGELLGAYGNLINRTLAMVIKTFGNFVPTPSEYKPEDTELIEKCKSLFDQTGNLIEQGELKQSLKEIFDVIRSTNKYIDTQAPWATASTDKERTATVLKICLDMILNLSSLCYPFIPIIAEKALTFLNQKPEWIYRELQANSPINQPVVLVKKLDKSIIVEEINRIGKA